ncbi:MAG: sugar phosphate isomerase/epimerase [Candidatus Yanofskybacteria bacterium]|nr:sugar phosphate isomerase/epimerase [Candidatus Yanofskybacteria bacterium]
MAIFFSIGIMQGRLTSPKGRGIQFFPFEEWDREFSEAAKLGLNEIEFIFDLDEYRENPLWTDEGVLKIKSLIRDSGVTVNNICADFFMRRPFFRVNDAIRKENVKVLKKLIEQANDIGAKNVEIPLLDNSSLKTSKEEEALAKSIAECLPIAQNHGVFLSLETDLPPTRFLELLKRFPNHSVKAVYDSGNSSSLGYDSYEEITTLGDFIINIHIKDRVLGGGTVPLGTGSADFDKLFSGLKKINYRGGFILQAARGEDEEEKKTVRSQMKFLKNYL